MYIEQEKGQVIPLHQFFAQKDFFMQEAKHNKIFVYPTDTLYGIGGVFNHQNIEKINTIKGRNTSKKLTIIAPSFEWIEENFYVNDIDYLKKALNTYHGVTYILYPKNPTGDYSLYETAYDNNSIGVRIIKHRFQDFVAELGVPFIATSANYAGGQNIHNIRELHEEIATHADYIIDGKNIYGKPSVLLYVESGRVVERE